MSDAEEYAVALTTDRMPENRCRMYVDAEGYALRVGGWYGMEFEDSREPSLEFLSFTRDQNEKYPLDPADIVMPPCWFLDEDGHGITAMEHAQIVRLAALLRLNDFAHTLTTQMRKAA
jgi:hypothetical protein